MLLLNRLPCGGRGDLRQKGDSLPTSNGSQGTIAGGGSRKLGLDKWERAREDVIKAASPCWIPAEESATAPRFDDLTFSGGARRRLTNVPDAPSGASVAVREQFC